MELLAMALPRFLLIAGRTSKQGQHVNIGKDYDEYKSIVTALTMHADDMKTLGLAAGNRVSVSTEFGKAEFICSPGNIPVGMVFVPYGPPTCQLMGGDTDGTGMPTSKGWEVEITKLDY
jgi:formylmethanofuran dehydrogenase subunit D